MKKETPYASSSSSRRILVVLALLLFIVALVLVIIQSTTNTRSPILKTYSQGYAEGYNDARNRARDLGFPNLQTTNKLNARIVKINGTHLEVSAEDLFLDDRVDSIGLNRTVVLNDGVIIVAQDRKDPQTLDEELNAFQRTFNPLALSENGEAPTPPSSYTEMSINASDLQVGDRIIIIAAEGEDVTMEETITPVKISKRAMPKLLEEEPEELIEQ